MRCQLVLKIGALVGLALVCAAAGPPPTQFNDLYSRTPVAVETWHGRVTLVSFWAKWCGPCLVELRGLPGLAAANPELRFVAASLDSRGAAQRWLARYPVPGVATVHVDGGAPKVLRQYTNGPLLLPFTIVLDPAGNICTSTVYRLDSRHLATLLARCQLRSPAAPVAQP